MNDGGPSGPGRLRATLSSSLLGHGVRSRLVITLVAGIVALAAAAAVGRSVVSSPAPAPTPAPVPAAPPAATPPNYVRFRDAAAGFSIAYPRSWSRFASPDSEVELLAAAKGRATSLAVRVKTVGLSVTPQTLPIARNLTDALVRADGRVQLLAEPQPLLLDGLPGYRYAYLFVRSNGGAGGHLHYFVFKGKRIITLVLQALPAQRLEQDLPLLERIAQTFRARVP
jgi:hypothetical protein